MASFYFSFTINISFFILASKNNNPDLGPKDLYWISKSVILIVGFINIMLPVDKTLAARLQSITEG